jgi:hypothetical protein
MTFMAYRLYDCGIAVIPMVVVYGLLTTIYAFQILGSGKDAASHPFPYIVIGNSNQ